MLRYYFFLIFMVLFNLHSFAEPYEAPHEVSSNNTYPIELNVLKDLIAVLNSTNNLLTQMFPRFSDQANSAIFSANQISDVINTTNHLVDKHMPNATGAVSFLGKQIANAISDIKNLISPTHIAHLVAVISTVSTACVMITYCLLKNAYSLTFQRNTQLTDSV